MNNVEVEQITDKYAYMNAKTFKEFLKLYPLSSTYEWAGMLLKWLVFTYVDDFETFRHFVLLPHRLAWNNGEIDIYEDNSVLDFIYEVDREKRGQITVTRGQQGYIALLPFCLRIMSLCVSIIHVQYTYIFNTLFFHKFFLFLRSSGMMPRYFFFLCAYQYHPRPHISPLGLALECAGVCGRVLAGQYWRGRVLYV